MMLWVETNSPCFEGHSLTNVHIYIQSGNVLFHSADNVRISLVTTIEGALSKT
jgi:uncharacterized protein (DUF1697 family)